MSVDRDSYTPSRAGILALELLARLPLRVLALLGTALGVLAYLLDKKRRRIVSTNLALCFPELAPRARQRLMRQHFRAVGRASLCNVAIAWWRSEARLARYVRLRGEEHYRAALARGPVVLMAPHFLSLEIGALRVTVERPFVGMYREPRRHLFHWALHRHRTRFGAIAFERGDNLKPMIRLMRAGRPCYYLPDIDLGDKTPHEFVPFFGIPAATVTGLNRIARIAGAEVVPCITREIGWGRYELTFLPPMAGVPSADPLADLRQMNALIEAEVRRTPAQYLWIHRRFKTRPPGERSLYG